MSVEHAASDVGHGAVVVTTGARFMLTADGHIDARQRLPVERATVRFAFDEGGSRSEENRAEPWRVEASDTSQAVLRRGTATATIRSDSVIILRTERPATVSTHAAFVPTYLESHRGRTLALDEMGGFGSYPVGAVPRRSGLGAPTRPGEETWLAVFPPRAADPAIESSPLAHEGRPQTLREGLDAAYPSRTVLEDAARHCRILALHAYAWRAAPLAARVRADRYFLRRCEWRTPRHEPADPVRFRRVMDDAHELGLRIVLYLSPRHSTAPDVFAEMARVLSEYAPDGLYLDGVADDLVTLDATVRRAREILGPDRILYLNAAAEPFGTPRVWAPFVDAHCDLVLRGSEGRDGLPLATFLRYGVSGRNTSGAAGYWCHYGGSLRERAPTDDEIRAVRTAGAHLWRRSRWGTAGLARFDAASPSRT